VTQMTPFSATGRRGYSKFDVLYTAGQFRAAVAWQENTDRSGGAAKAAVEAMEFPADLGSYDELSQQADFIAVDIMKQQFHEYLHYAPESTSVDVFGGGRMGGTYHDPSLRGWCQRCKLDRSDEIHQHQEGA